MIVEWWDFNPAWLEYVVSSHAGTGRVELVSDDSEARLAFKEAATQAFIRNGFTPKQVKTYLSIQCPEEGSGYAEGFPHIHYPLDGVTLIHYLQPGDNPAPLDIFEDGNVIETIYPEAGKTVFMPHMTRHGVRKNNGTTNRVQFIASGLPR